MTPKVSVLLITYNHGKFIKKAIDGILMQKTDFQFELVIGDDCSPDNTRNIIEDCLKKTKIIVKRSYNETNQGVMENIRKAYMRCEGQYIAYIEGDDFWTDETKLQSQVDFLDSHPDYIEIAHQCSLVDRKGKLEREIYKVFSHVNEYTLDVYSLFQLPGQSSTLMVRNLGREVMMDVKKVGKIRICPFDRVIPLLLFSKGKIYVLDNVMSAYRYDISAGSTSWSAKNNGEKVQKLLYYFFMTKELEQIAKRLEINLNCNYIRTMFFGKALYNARNSHKLQYYSMCFIMLIFTFHKRSFIRSGMETYHREIMNEKCQ